MFFGHVSVPSVNQGFLQSLLISSIFRIIISENRIRALSSLPGPSGLFFLYPISVSYLPDKAV